LHELLRFGLESHNDRCQRIFHCKITHFEAEPFPLSLTPYRRYFALLLFWSARDLRNRYAGSVFGLLWAVVQPLATIALFYGVFGLILAIRLPEASGKTSYFFFLLSGLLPWLAIQEAWARSVTAISGNELLLQKQTFPLSLFPLAPVLTALVPQLVGFALLLPLLAWRAPTPPAWELLPWVFFCQLTITAGVALPLAALNHLIRDLAAAVPIVLQILFYTGAILFPAETLDEPYRAWLLANPIACLAMAYQETLLGLPAPAGTWAALFAWTVASGLGGVWLFRFLHPIVLESL